VKSLKKEIAASEKEVGDTIQQIKDKTGTQKELLQAIDNSQKGLIGTKEDRDRAANIRKYATYLFSSFSLSSVPW
jgi:hypothetical protein